MLSAVSFQIRNTISSVRHSCSAVVLVVLPTSSAQWVEITAVPHMFRAAWAFGVLFLLVFCEDAFLSKGRGRSFYRWLSEGIACWPL